jgi:hypothetical protein
MLPLLANLVSDPRWTRYTPALQSVSYVLNVLYTSSGYLPDK